MALDAGASGDPGGQWTRRGPSRWVYFKLGGDTDEDPEAGQSDDQAEAHPEPT